MIDVLTRAHDLRTCGFAVLPAVYGEPSVRALRSALESEYERAGRPPMIAEGHLVDTAAGTGATAAGFAVGKLLRTRPELAPILLTEGLVEVLRAALGDDMVLELAGGLVSDASRPFFKWHNHVGGIDDHLWEKRGADYPRSAEPQRVLVLVYLQPITPALGSLLVLPRGPGDPALAPHALDALHWEGEVVIEAPAGTAVLIEQSTWHAALPQEADGLRMFVGFYFASSAAPPAATDETLLALDTDVPLLRSVLPRS